MAAKLGNYRLAMGMVFSLLLHLLVFFSFILLLQHNKTIPKANKPANFQVRLTQATSPKIQAKHSGKLVSASSPAQFKVDLMVNYSTPDATPITPETITEQTAPDTSEITGIAFPGAVASPFPGQIRTHNPIFNAPISPQDGARNLYQQAMDARSRPRPEQQAQLMMLQLQQTLARLLEGQPVVSGNCELSESGTGMKIGLQCNSDALYALLLKDQQNVLSILNMLRRVGRKFSGFSVTNHNNLPFITLIYDTVTREYELQIPLPPSSSVNQPDKYSTK